MSKYTTKNYNQNEEAILDLGVAQYVLKNRTDFIEFLINSWINNRTNTLYDKKKADDKRNQPEPTEDEKRIELKNANYI